MSSGELAESGLEVVITPLKNGRVKLELINDQGEVIHTNEHKNRNSARASATFWVKKHYAIDTVEVPSQALVPVEKPKRKSPTPKTRPMSIANMVKTIEGEAMRHDAAAADHRMKADDLEMQAKRLRAALNVLQEGDGLG